jgi:hypothetical protein
MALEQLSTLQPLDPTTLRILQQLQALRFPFTLEVYGNLLRLANQNMSVLVQDAAFELMKKIVQGPEVAQIIPVTDLIDLTMPLFQASPQYVITIVRLLARTLQGGATDLITKFLSLSQSHATVELIEAVITANAAAVPPAFVLNVLNQLDERYATLFMRYALSAYGPIPEFLPAALSRAEFLPLFVKALARLCESELDRVKEMIGAAKLNVESQNDLKGMLEELVVIVANMDGEMNEKKAHVIYSLMLTNCVKYGCPQVVLPLMALVARVPSFLRLLAEGPFWPVVRSQMNASPTDLDHAAALVQQLPLCEDATLLTQIWEGLVASYAETKRPSIVPALRSILKRTKQLPMGSFVKVIQDGLRNPSQEKCLEALKCARSLDGAGLTQLHDSAFWDVLSGQLLKKDEALAKSIGHLCRHIVTEMPNFTPNAAFFAHILNTLYDPRTEFDVAMHFIMFLSQACRTPEVLAFLYRRHFSSYLEQLPWRYYNDKRIPEALQFAAAQLVKHYGGQVNVSMPA